jgi:hypothetical protein
MASVEVNLFDSKKFNDTLRLYVMAQRKELADSINHIAKNIAYMASQFTEPSGSKASASSNIKSSLENLPITKDDGRKRSGNTAFVGALKLMNWQRKNSGLPPVGGSRFRKTGNFRRVIRRDEDGEIKSYNYIEKRKKVTSKRGLLATGKLRKFIARRANSAKFIKIGWVASYQKFLRGAASGGEGFKQGTADKVGDAKLAKPGVVVEAMTINRAGQYDIRFNPKRTSGMNTPGRTTSGAIRIGTPALIKAIEFVRKDMISYIMPRLQRIANRYNARG